MRAPRSRRQRWLLALTAALLIAAVSAYVWATPLLTAAGEQLVHADPLQKADAVMVLAPLLERVVEAAELYRAGYAPLVLITRESRDSGEQLLIDRGLIRSGEDERARILHELGVPGDAIVVLEPIVESTADEARALAEWAAARALSSVIVVTSPSHTVRARLTFLHALEGRPVSVVLRPSRLSAFRADSWWRSRTTLREGILEWQKLVFYYFVELRRGTFGNWRATNAS